MIVLTAAARWCRSFLSRFTGPLHSSGTSPGRAGAGPSFATPPAPPTLADRESTSLEILQLVHDLRDQLTIMRFSATEAADASSHLGAERRRELQQSIERAVRLIDALLLDERSLLARRRPVDANEITRRTAATLASASPGTVRVQLALWPEPLAVIADVGDLDRVLLNLMLNAYDAMPDGGVLTVETALAEVRSPIPGMPPGRYARVTVRDTGCGMTADVKARIFDPFFTTRRSGTGLGLCSVAFTILQLQGRISVDSTPGVGTSVTIMLPGAPEPPGPPAS